MTRFPETQIQRAEKSTKRLARNALSASKHLRDVHQVNTIRLLHDELYSKLPQTSHKSLCDTQLDISHPVRIRSDGVVVGGVTEKEHYKHYDDPSLGTATSPVVDVLDDTELPETSKMLYGKLTVKGKEQQRFFCAEHDDECTSKKRKRKKTIGVRHCDAKGHAASAPTSCRVEEIVSIDDADTRTLSTEDVVVCSEILALAKPHQKEGITFCVENLQKDQGVVLAHTMGLGKTFTLISTVDAFFRAKRWRTLLIVPKSTQVSWKAEVDRWKQHLQVPFYWVNNGSDMSTTVKKWKRKPGVLQMTYHLFLMHSRHHDALQAEWWSLSDLLVIDEAHLITNPSNKLFQLISHMPIKHRIALTGTPFSNNLVEYYTMVSLVAPNLFEKEDIHNALDFKKRFANIISVGQTKDATLSQLRSTRQHTHVLRKMLDTVVHRKTVALLTHSLPCKTEFVVRYMLNEHSQKQYDSVEQQTGCFEIWQHLMNVSGVDDRIRITCSLLDEFQKCGERCVVFSQRRSPLRLLQQIRKDGMLFTGGLGQEHRRDIIHRFQANDFREVSTRNIYMSTTCGSMGLTLTAATRVILMDCSWNPSFDIQATFRVYRMGQTRPVFIYRLIARNTVEDHCYRLQLVKTALTRNLIEDKQIANQFTKEELHHQFKNAPIVGLDPCQLTDEPLFNVCKNDPTLHVAKHDHSIDDDDALSENEKTEAENNVNNTRNKQYRTCVVPNLNFSERIVAGPKDKWFVLAPNRDDKLIPTTCNQEYAMFPYRPYIPYIKSRRGDSLDLLIGPHQVQEIRLKWGHQELKGRTETRLLTYEDSNPDMEYWSCRVTLPSYGVFVVTARSLLTKPSGEEVWSEWTPDSSVVTYMDDM